MLKPHLLDMISDMRKLWYAVATKPRLEFTVLENLQRQSFEAFLPLISLRKRRQNKWQQVIEPMFPGYLFIHTDPESENVAPIRSTRGAIGLVKFGGVLVPLPDALVGELQKLSDAPAEGPPVFSAGESVVFAQGPLKGLEAVFTLQKGRDRADVLLKLMGQLRTFEVDLDDLSKV